MLFRAHMHTPAAGGPRSRDIPKIQMRVPGRPDTAARNPFARVSLNPRKSACQDQLRYFFCNFTKVRDTPASSLTLSGRKFIVPPIQQTFLGLQPGKVNEVSP